MSVTPLVKSHGLPELLGFQSRNGLAALRQNVSGTCFLKPGTERCGYTNSCVHTGTHAHTHLNTKHCQKIRLHTSTYCICTSLLNVYCVKRMRCFKMMYFYSILYFYGFQCFHIEVKTSAEYDGLGATNHSMSRQI